MGAPPDADDCKRVRIVRLAQRLVCHTSFLCALQVKEGAIKRLGTRFALLDKTLASSPFLTGDSFSISDGYLFTVMRWADNFKLDLSVYPNLTVSWRGES